jgi:hypothetical protein
MIQENSEKKNANSNNLSYMMFAFGALLIVVGIYLSTYTTVVMVNQSMSIYGYSLTIPQPQQIQPYLIIGIVAILSALALIGIAFYKIKKAT